MSKLDKLNNLKEEIVNEILADESLSKIEKLEKIEKNKLWGYATYIQDEFPEWTEEFKKELGVAHPCIDSMFDPSHFKHEKYETVSYSDELKYLEDHFEDYADDYDEDEDEVMNTVATYPVLTNRTNDKKVWKTKEQIIDAVFKHCVKEKIVGYKNDW